MIIVTHGSRSFDDYSVFLRSMFTSLYMMQPEDKEFIIYSAGPLRINQMSEEYLNVSNFKARGIKTKLIKVNYDFVKNNYDKIDYIIYYCNKGEPIEGLINFAKEKNIENAVYRF